MAPKGKRATQQREDSTKTSVIQRLKAGYNRVVYSENLLVEVIFQYRFPTVLRIEAEKPVEFQEDIRDQFPFYEERENIEIKMEFIGPDVIPKKEVRKSYVFISQDRNSRVEITSSMFTIIFSKYSSWEEAKKLSQKIFGAICKIHRIKLIERVGLRYRNLISTEWMSRVQLSPSDVLNPSFSGPLQHEFFKDFTFDGAQWVHRLSLEDVNVLLQGGLLKQVGGINDGYLIDTDLSIQCEGGLDASRVLERADELHDISGPVFRWCISDRVHNLLAPK